MRLFGLLAFFFGAAGGVAGFAFGAGGCFALRFFGLLAFFFGAAGCVARLAVVARRGLGRCRALGLEPLRLEPRLLRATLLRLAPGRFLSH